MHKELLEIFGPTIAEMLRRVLNVILVKAGLCPDCVAKVRRFRDEETG